MKIPNRMQGHWKVMIVDDDVGVHDVTKLVLGDFSFNGQAIEFVSAYSDREAREAIQAHPDTAAILLDVVMDDDDSGLKFVRYLREERRGRQHCKQDEADTQGRQGQGLQACAAQVRHPLTRR